MSIHPLNAALLAICSCLPLSAQSAQAIQQQDFGKTPEGQQVYLYTLKNSSGMEVKITNFGARITSIKVMDRNKKFDDVVLGFDNLESYMSKNDPYFGAVAGRYANRIANGAFTLDGKQYHIPLNEPTNALHGGTTGFDRRVWDGKDVSTADGQAVELHYLSPDGEMGFPGNLNVTVRYSLGNKNDLRLDYTATTDQDTVLNLTNHSYFNLAGAGSETALNHKVMIAADRFTPINGNLIPTGAIEKLAGTPLDFRKLEVVGARINDSYEQLKLAKGYDHNFVLNRPGNLSALAARVEEPSSGRVLECFTTEPGLQFYTGNFLDGTIHGIGGVYRYRSALTLETQHFPDSPNHPNFPTTVLHAGQQFRSTTIFRFSTR
ncbi:MAG: aldose epimerase family protein [Bryobacteraceae bacterium]